MKSYFIEELFYDTLHSEEVAFAIHTKCELYSFIRQFCKWKCLWEINVSQFV